jgi:hypothetical protein
MEKKLRNAIMRAIIILVLLILLVHILDTKTDYVTNLIIATVSSKLSALINEIYFSENEFYQFMINMIVPFIIFFIIMHNDNWAKNMLIVGIISNLFATIDDILRNAGIIHRIVI